MKTEPKYPNINKKTMRHFLRLPKSLSAYKELNSSDKLVWACLYNFSNDKGIAWPKQITIADTVGLSTDQVIRCIKRLEEQDFIWKEKAEGSNHRLHVTNRYYILAHPILEDCEEITSHPATSKTEITSQLAPSYTRKRLNQNLKDCIVFSKEKSTQSEPSCETKLTHCLKESRDDYLNNNTVDSCPEDIAPYVNYWEEHYSKTRRVSKTFDQITQTLRTMISGSFFDNKNVMPGYTLSLEDFQTSVDNYKLAMQIDHGASPDRKPIKYTLLSFLWNWNATSLKCPFIRYLQYKPKPIEKLYTDINPKLTAYLTELLIKENQWTKNHIFLATEEEKLRLASNQFHRWYNENQNRFITTRNLYEMAELYFLSIAESLPDTVKPSPGHLCSERTWKRVFPDFCEKRGLLSKAVPTQKIDPEVIKQDMEREEKERQRLILENQDWYDSSYHKTA